MGKTKRNASRWMETQNKMWNGTTSYYSLKIDPLSYKVISWKDFGHWAKRDARQAARHKTKLLVSKLTQEMLLEALMDLEEQLIDDDWYGETMMEFDFSYSDEDSDYAEQRRRCEEEEEDAYYDYDPYPYYGIDDRDY